MREWIFYRIKKAKWLLLAAIPAMIWYALALPDPLFKDPYSTVLQASNGQLLSATLAHDGQWRFPESDSVSEKFSTALIAFEDKRFYSHLGFDPLALGRAVRQNIKAGHTVSGGSTISMQVIRLSRKGKSRTFFEKCIEIVLATRLELQYSKAEIMALYAAHAPFGGNVVGLDAACWRYFGADSKDLSWGEACLLAVLPNSPSLIHPGKNRDALLRKRNELLDKLRANGVLDPFTCDLAKAERMPEAPLPLPRLAPHLLTRITKEGHAGKVITSTIDEHLQQRIEAIVQDHHERLKGNRIFNVAAVVVEVNSGNILAYAGNIRSSDPSHESDVDVIAAPRSTGSILKPFLYAAMLDEGKILPQTILPDVPVMINGFAPKNFSQQYDGAVHADKALIRSLNVPAVHLLQEYRYEKFHALLKDLGMTTLTQQPDHYGLSLILGGAEGTLYDITGMYASIARTLNHYFDYPGQNRYIPGDVHSLRYVSQGDEHIPTDATGRLSAASLYLTFEALKDVFRPGEETGWRYFNSSKTIAWKTGTSFGLRDGWAVGVTPEFAVGVWVGNADGEGRPGLTGTEAASPVMFDIFAQLPPTSWFQKPQPEMERIVTCAKSGQRYSAACEKADTIWVTKTGLETKSCEFHKVIHLSHDERYRVHSECASIAEMKHKNWFVLPPIQEYYFKPKNTSYKILPEFRPDCVISNTVPSMELIYPKTNAKIFIPRELDGKPGSSVFELAHRNPVTEVYWHLDGIYIGSTKRVHHLPMNPSEGKHILTLVDDQGQSIERSFVVISKM